MTDLVKHGSTLVRFEVDKWLADCPREHCTNAMMVWRGQDLFVCEGPHACGAVGELVWPRDPDAIEYILAMRPVPITRIWLAHEKLEELMKQNAVLGAIPDEWVALGRAQPGGGLNIMGVDDERVVDGVVYQQLDAAGLRPRLEAATASSVANLRQIGA